MYKKVDNYLSSAQHKLITAQVFNPTTKWAFLKNVTKTDRVASPTSTESWIPGMGSGIFHVDAKPQVENTALWTSIQPLIDYNIGPLLRVKLGIVFSRLNKEASIINNCHVDWNIPHITQLYYVTDSNAPTYLYNEKQEPDKEGYHSPKHEDLTVMEVSEHKANSCIFFDGLHYHASSSPEPFDIRVNININYAKK